MTRDNTRVVSCTNLTLLSWNTAQLLLNHCLTSALHIQAVRVRLACFTPDIQPYQLEVATENNLLRLFPQIYHTRASCTYGHIFGGEAFSTWK